MTTCRWGHPWAFAWSPLFYITTSACLSSCSLFAASKLAAATTDFGEKRREQSQQARTALLSQKLCRSQGASRRQQAESIGDSSELFAVCSDLFPHTNVTNVRISAVRISPRHTQQATHQDEPDAGQHGAAGDPVHRLDASRVPLGGGGGCGQRAPVGRGDLPRSGAGGEGEHVCCWLQLKKDTSPAVSCLTYKPPYFNLYCCGIED